MSRPYDRKNPATARVIPAAKDNAAVYALKNPGKLTINGGNFTLGKAGNGGWGRG